MFINCLHIIPLQTVSRAIQTTPRHLPDTLQTPQNIEYFDQSGKWEKRKQLIKMSLCWMFITPPEIIQMHSDNPRHPPGTFLTPYRDPRIWHFMANPRQFREKEHQLDIKAENLLTQLLSDLNPNV